MNKSTHGKFIKQNKYDRFNYKDRIINSKLLNKTLMFIRFLIIEKTVKYKYI